jgi:hypothetical protein
LKINQTRIRVLSHPPIIADIHSTQSSAMFGVTFSSSALNRVTPSAQATRRAIKSNDQFASAISHHLPAVFDDEPVDDAHIGYMRITHRPCINS